MGYRIGEYIKEKKPDGGTVCTIEGNPAADNILRRAQGMRDALSGTEGLATLDGSEEAAAGPKLPAARCSPMTTAPRACRRWPTSSPPIPTSTPSASWAAGRCSGAATLPRPVPAARRPIASGDFVIAAADTIGDEVAIAKEGLVTALVGQRPFEMGYLAPTVMIDLIEGKEVADPVFTGLDECTKDTADTCIQK